MKKLLLIAAVTVAAAFAIVYFLFPKEEDAETLKKYLSDNFAAYTAVASYMQQHPGLQVSNSKKEIPEGDIEADFKKVFSETILYVKSVDGAVLFSTGHSDRTNSERFTIYSPSGAPAAYPDAFSAEKTDWYLCEVKG